MADRVERFKTELVAAFGHRIECLAMVGSHARGDAHAGSDIDLWLFLDRVSLEDLRVVGQLVARAGRKPEINVQCATFAEVATGSFQEGFSPLQLHFDGCVLHGELRLPPPTERQVLAAAGAISAFVLMSCRHYIASQEPEESLAKGKIRNWVLKPLMWALRYDVLARTGTYPVTIEELAQTPISQEARDLVLIFKQLLTSDCAGPCMPIVERAEALSRLLVQRVEGRQGV